MNFNNVLGDLPAHKSAISAAKTEEARWFSLSLKDRLQELLAQALVINNIDYAEIYRKRLEEIPHA